MAGTVQYAGRPRGRRKKVYYSGTDTLQDGYNLCYDEGATADASDDKAALGNQVEKPNATNLNGYAGCVAEGQGGKVGPCFVEIVEPTKGTYVDLFTDANMTLAVTMLGPQSGSYALKALTASATHLARHQIVALAGQTTNTDTTNANAWAMFL